MFSRAKCLIEMRETLDPLTPGVGCGHVYHGRPGLSGTLESNGQEELSGISAIEILSRDSDCRYSRRRGHELVSAQTLTGQIGGTVVDSQKAVIFRARQCPSGTPARKSLRDAVSDSNGVFVLTNLIAGTYDVKVTLTGFKTYEQKGLVLSATERLSLPPIALEVGGSRKPCRSRPRASASRRRAVNARRPSPRRNRRHRPARPRLHGHAEDAARSRRYVRARRARLGIGQRHDHQRADQLQFFVRRHHEQGHRLELGNYAAPALDSIAEVKVQASNFQAEYGRSSGATIIVVTKSGSRTSADCGLLPPQRGLQREHLGSAPQPATRPRLSGSAAALRQATVSVRQHRVDASAARCSFRAPTSTRSGTSCSSSGRRTSCRATTPAA